MRNAVLAIGAGLIAILCFGGAAAAFVLLSQVRGSPLPFLRSLTLQRQAQSQACPVPSSLVPGTYLADPVRVSGDWVVLTYAAECATPGQPRQTINGYVAEDGWGSGCGGSGSLQPITPSASGPVTIFVEGPGQCDGVGGAAGLSVIPGVVTRPGAATAQALFASGPSASAPIRAGRFVIVAPNGTAVCSVRAVDAGGAVLAEQKLGWPSPKVTQGACPQP